jgi:predicted nucleic acid-binding protein
MLLVDSTIYIDLLRAGRDPVVELTSWVETGQLLCCGIIRCEVLRGIRTPRVKARMKELFDIAADAPFTPEVWARTAELAWKLDRAGIVLPLSDLAIGTCALVHDAEIVSTEAHFGRIPGLRTRGAIPIAP